jgi:hypothetical protein
MTTETTEDKSVSYWDEYFGNGEHRFDLVPGNWDLLIELERTAECGVFFLFGKLSNGQAGVTHVREIVRLGLIGGGKSPKEAEALVKTYFDRSPLADGVSLAVSILGAAIYGRKPGKPIVVEEVADEAD